MTLGASLQIGRTGLLASQAALEVAGNNLANVATRGYHRQTISLAPNPYQEIQQGVFAGRGVQISSITRQIDEALEARLRGAVSDGGRSAAMVNLLSQVESLQNEFTEADLSTRLGTFFNAWSQLANNPQDQSLRTLVVQEAATLSTFIRDLDQDLGELQLQTDRTTGQVVETVNDLLSRIEQVNQSIALAEGGNPGGAGGLRDQRDQLLSELSQYLDISTVESPNGVVDVFVGSIPIVLNGRSRGVELRERTIDGQVQTDVVVAADQSPLDISSGELGALVQFRQNDLQDAIDTLDTLASQLIYQVNRIHSQSQGLSGYTSLTSQSRVIDASAALNDLDATGLDFAAGHGSFQLHLTQKSTGQQTTTTINIDLDGINPAGDTTLTSLAAEINAVSGVSAVVTADGRLQIDSASADFEVTFSDDSSGVLAALGINTFFTGGDAFDIDVNAALLTSPDHLAAARGHLPGDNSGALAIADLRDQSLGELNGQSLTRYWNRHVEDFAIRLAQAQEQERADAVVRESLEAQQQSVSGVNMDEETIDLIRYQSSYQASARFLSVVDELYRTLLGLI